ncbi:hypothetical protein [Arthrobacter sp. B6]|uniref:hypothetical protein n=1 Tax=Arthrobacter sp. B6 TaxID=1570137 RepID=UPI000A87C644|nr:hypothetical protein [Arthrobacter sp. B6]
MRTGLQCHRHFVKALFAGVIVLCLPGCSEAPEEDWYAIANGADTEVGKVEVRSLILVASAENEAGRLLGTLYNTSDEPLNVTLSDEDDNVTIRVEGQSNLGLDTHAHFFSSVSEIPGSRVPVTITVGPDSTQLDTPVLDGTLQAYRPYVPTSTPSP